MGCIGTPSGLIATRTTASLVGTWLGSAETVTNATTFDFGSFTAGSDGLLVACVTIRGDSSSLTLNAGSSTIDGAAIDGNVNAGAGPVQVNCCLLYMWKAVTAGSRNVTAVLSGASGASTRGACSVWLLTGYTSATPYAYGAFADASANPIIVGFSAAPRSVALIGAIKTGTGDATVDSFSSGVADQADNEIGTSGSHFRSATYTNNTDVEGPQTLSVTFSAAGAQSCACFAAWK